MDAKSGMPQLILEAIKGLTAALKSGVNGFIASHVAEIGMLNPETIRVNMITFHARVSSGGVITQAASVRLSSDYKFELTGITAAMQLPTGAVTEYADFARFTFQMRESGRNYDIFDTGPINLLPLLSTAGPGSLIEFPRGTYVFNPGSEITGTFAADSVGGSFSAVAKSIVAMLVGNYIRK